MNYLTNSENMNGFPLQMNINNLLSEWTHFQKEKKLFLLIIYYKIDFQNFKTGTDDICIFTFPYI